MEGSQPFAALCQLFSFKKQSLLHEQASTEVFLNKIRVNLHEQTTRPPRDWRGEFGGAEQHILNLVTTFPVEEVDVAVVCFYDSLFAEKLRAAGIKVIALNQFGRFDIRLLQALRRTFLAFGPAIIHTHGIKANFFPGWPRSA